MSAKTGIRISIRISDFSELTVNPAILKDKLPDGSSETGPNKWAPVASSPTASAIKAKVGWGARTWSTLASRTIALTPSAASLACFGTPRTAPD